jgi:hypothetical protein
LPLPRFRWLCRRPIPMVAHLPRPFGCAGDLHSSFPELLMPSTLPVSAGFQVSLVAPASSSIACDTVLRSPLVPYLRLYRRWIVESPRFSHLSAVPVVKAPGCPFTLRPRYRRRSVSRLPQMLILRHRLVNSPSLLGFAPAGSPSSNLRIAPSTRFGLRRSINPQVALVLALSTSPIPSAPSCPKAFFLG